MPYPDNYSEAAHWAHWSEGPDFDTPSEDEIDAFCERQASDAATQFIAMQAAVLGKQHLAEFDDLCAALVEVFHDYTQALVEASRAEREQF